MHVLTLSVVPNNIIYVFAGYAFIYFFDERDADDAIRALDNTPFGYGRRRLTVEWSKVTIDSPFNPKMLTVEI